jgi:hypothetical protein
MWMLRSASLSTSVKATGIRNVLVVARYPSYFILQVVSIRLSGGQLRTDRVLDFETAPLLSIRVRVTDSGGNTLDKVFQIQVTGNTADDDDADGLTEEQEILIGSNPLNLDSDHKRLRRHSRRPAAISSSALRRKRDSNVSAD